MSSKCNPLGLNIGDKVTLHGTRLFEYDNDRNRDSVFHKFSKPREFFIVGVCKKACGKYQFGSQRGSLAFDSYNENYEPPFLVVSHYVRVYECKESMIDRRVYLAEPGDIVQVEFDMSDVSKRIKTGEQCTTPST